MNKDIFLNKIKSSIVPKEGIKTFTVLELGTTRYKSSKFHRPISKLIQSKEYDQ